MEEAGNTTEARDIMALGSALSDPLSAPLPKEGGSTPFVVVPEGYKVQDLEHLFQTPARVHGHRTMRDVDSFVATVAMNAGDNTILYGCLNPPSFKAVFNESSTGAPGWADHTCTYDCALAIEWKTWKGSDGKQMDQAAFAKFIEDNAPDCLDPTAADMIEIARTLEAKKKVNFASAVRLDNGQTDLTYEEEIQGTAAKGRLQIPQVFQIAIPVFENSARYTVEARLRYRIGEGGKLSLWYDLVRPHKTLEAQVREVWKQISASLGMTVLNGH